MVQQSKPFNRLRRTAQPVRGRLGQTVRRTIQQDGRLWLTAIGMAGGVLLLRMFSLLQNLELSALDALFHSRPAETPDQRIVLVSVDEADLSTLKEWPMTDVQMAKMLTHIKAQQPRVIGLDFYRDFPVGSGHDQLEAVFKSTPNLIAIEKLSDQESKAVPPPPALPLEQVGFNDSLVDADGRVRRAVLFLKASNLQASDQPSDKTSAQPVTHRSFALQLATHYLHDQAGITLKRINGNHLRLGGADLYPLQPTSGGYVNVDSVGYQILVNLRKAQEDRPADPTDPNPISPLMPFKRVALKDVLAGNIPPGLMRDRIVLIGSTAPSLRDIFYSSYSDSLGRSAAPISGVELQGQIVSQLLSAALDGRSLIQVWPDPVEWLWIFAWSWLGAAVSWKIRSPGRSALGVMLLGAGLVWIGYTAFLEGWWIPLAPPLLAMLGSTVLVTAHLAHLEEELKKSKEFLHSIINTIPDPVFVKNQQHRWIVLNEAYCRFSGYSMDALLDKTVHDVFPRHQAEHVWMQDELTFSRGTEQESEEEFTDAKGVMYSIATKRSLHRDAAGNVFLVGVIRDITQRKRLEETLRRSNAELQEAKDVLTRMAYHDSLTGLPNRKLFHERLTQALDHARTQQHLVALLFLDLDGFKQVNDTCGHQIGDLLLKAVANRLLGCLRNSDTVARLGGDEFVAILPGIPSVQDVGRVADKILMTLSQHFILESQRVAISTSIGISLYPTDSDTMDDLIIKADAAMYCAKQLGKNRHEFFHESAELSLPE